MNVPTAWSSQVRHLAARIPCNPARLPVQAFLALCIDESMQRCLSDALHAAMCKMRHTLCRERLIREPRRVARHPGSNTHADAFRKACRDVFLMPYMLRRAANWLQGTPGSGASKGCVVPWQRDARGCLQESSGRRRGTWAASGEQLQHFSAQDIHPLAIQGRPVTTGGAIHPLTLLLLLPQCLLARTLAQENPDTGAGAASREQRQHLCV